MGFYRKGGVNITDLSIRWGGKHHYLGGAKITRKGGKHHRSACDQKGGKHHRKCKGGVNITTLNGAKPSNLFWIDRLARRTEFQPAAHY